MSSPALPFAAYLFLSLHCFCSLPICPSSSSAMTVDLEKQHLHNASQANSVEDGHSNNGYPLAPTKSRNSQHGVHKKHTLANKPDGVDEAVWMEEVSVEGIQERKVRPFFPFSCSPRALR